MDPGLQVPASAGSSKGGSRPASQQPASSASQQQPPRKRASHAVTSNTQTPHVPDDNLPAYRDVYSHPAAVAYAAAHPRRTIPKFGPYLLLQTLGEGEFGKVKLGLHMQWGEEVAVKLIRRGNIDSSARMSKVEREIEVLRTLKHPNIVRLYDVIETDKYIGIILEYASGGELFDHILAHRYLKEKDACRLFSQLISGVWYIHQKKIVHRDLKLENLLLDRHRNVIITDFGFANRFEHKSDELMQTSCGSPCYAAPELVISDGMYVGSAVDVWSCGVILYAMLAGYLPFDDDPANPDGDNINLLYRYIVNTPLSFPDYVSPEARDLLSIMLVPDPRVRADLPKVMAHAWLQPYVHLFSRGIGELEHSAMEQHQAKRMAYQKQMKASAAAESQQKMSRSQSARTDGYANSVNVVPSSRSRSQREYSEPQQQEYLYETSADQSMYSPPAPAPAARRAATSQIVLPSGSNLMVDDDPFAPSPSREKMTSPLDEVLKEGEASRSKKEKDGAVPEAKRANNGPTIQPVNTSPDPKKKKGGFRHTIQVEYGEDEESQPQPSAANPSPPVFTAEPEKTESRANGARRSSTSSPRDKSTRKNSLDSQATPSKGLPPTPSSGTRRRTPSKSSTTPAVTSPNHQQPAIEITSPPTSPTVEDKAAYMGSMTNGAPTSKHKKGLSMDKIGLGKIFGGSSSEPQSNGVNSNGSSRVPSDPDARQDATASPTGPTRRPSTLQVMPSQSPTGGAKSPSLLSPVNSSGASATSSKKGSTRRNTLTVMVEPFRNKKSKTRTPSTDVPPQEKTETQGPKSAVSPPTATAKFPVSQRDFGVNSNLASTNKAKKVMDWFRTKSKGRVPTEDEPTSDRGAPPSAASIAPGSSTSTVNNTAIVVQQSDEPTPPPKSSASGHPHRTPSAATDRSFTDRVRSVVVSSSGGSAPKNVLRVHHGAVDQTTITSGSPPDVMKHVLQVLESMGLDIQEESLYKFRCIRPKKKKLGSTGVGLNGAGSGLAAFSISGSAGSGGVDKRGLPLPSGGAGMLKGLLMRRQSSQVSNSASPTTSAGASPNMDNNDALDASNSSLAVNGGEPVSSTGSPTIFGDQTEDQGGEVRFSVELTRLDRLDELYSLDIRRLKGNLKSYKYLYDSLRDRANLQQR